MLVFLDTEFTDLVFHPRLLSVALVTDLATDREFYAEVTDLDRIRATSWFALGTVLPLFGQVDQAACSYAELGRRLATFLADLAARLRADEYLDLAHGYPLDWELVDLALADARSSTWAATRPRIRPVNVYPLTGFGPGKRAAEAYFKAQEEAPLPRHHALCDARAMRLAYDAATQAPAVASQANTLMTRPPDLRAAA